VRDKLTILRLPSLGAKAVFVLRFDVRIVCNGVHMPLFVQPLGNRDWLNIANGCREEAARIFAALFECQREIRKEEHMALDSANGCDFSSESFDNHGILVCHRVVVVSESGTAPQTDAV
jgi:hypothetical protein